MTSVQAPSFFIRTCQHDLRPPTHAQRLELGVQCLCGKFQALLEHEPVEVGQDGGIKTDGVFYQQYHLYSGRHVVLQVHFVFYQLDDREQQVRITQPTKHVIENRKVHVLHTLPDTMAERSQHDDRYRGIVRLDAPCDVEHVIIVRSGHTDNQIESGLAQLFFRLFLRSDLEKTGRIAQTQFHVFIENLFFHPSVILQHESVIRVGDEQHIENAPLHQVHKSGIPQERAFFVFIVCHNSLSLSLIAETNKHKNPQACKKCGTKKRYPKMIISGTAPFSTS